MQFLFNIPNKANWQDKELKQTAKIVKVMKHNDEQAC
jgi:hypothetical protein